MVSNMDDDDDDGDDDDDDDDVDAVKVELKVRHSVFGKLLHSMMP
jgi:hypothetical protein